MLGHAGYAARQHELDHTDQEYILPERSRSWSGNRLSVRCMEACLRHLSGTWCLHITINSSFYQMTSLSTRQTCPSWFSILLYERDSNYKVTDCETEKTKQKIIAKQSRQANRMPTYQVREHNKHANQENNNYEKWNKPKSTATTISGVLFYVAGDANRRRAVGSSSSTVNTKAKHILTLGMIKLRCSKRIEDWSPWLAYEY